MKNNHGLKLANQFYHQVLSLGLDDCIRNSVKRDFDRIGSIFSQCYLDASVITTHKHGFIGTVLQENEAEYLHKVLKDKTVILRMNPLSKANVRFCISMKICGYILIYKYL